MHKNQTTQQNYFESHDNNDDKIFTKQDLDAAISRTIARERKKYEVRMQMKKESTRQTELIEVIEIKNKDLEFFQQQMKSRNTLIIKFPKGKKYNTILLQSQD